MPRRRRPKRCAHVLTSDPNPIQTTLTRRHPEALTQRIHLCDSPLVALSLLPLPCSEQPFALLYVAIDIFGGLEYRLTTLQFTALRAPARVPAVALSSPSLSFARRFISQEVRAKLQQAVESTPVVLFMKGTPEAPQCGFSRAAVQVLDIHGVPPEKMKTFDVLEDSELRSSIKEFSCVHVCTCARTGCGMLTYVMGTQ